MKLELPHYPRPKIPLHPVLSLGSLGQSPGKAPPSVLDAGNHVFVTSARFAIALALAQMKIGRHDKVLVPAFHCTSMISPILHVGATPAFYRIRPDTSVDLDSAGALLDPSVKAILVPNYFGFPQDLQRIRAFCDKHGIFMLEDCAHAFFGECDGKPLGSFGDYAVASTWKFFPVLDGGCLVSSRRSLGSTKLQALSLYQEIKLAVNTLEKACEYGRLPLLKLLMSLPVRARALLTRKRQEPRNQEQSAPAAQGSVAVDEPRFDSHLANKLPSRISRILVRFAGKRRAAMKRRENYLYLQTRLRGLTGTRFLHPELGDGTYPYVLPVVVDAPESVFPILKNRGVPILRFGEFLWPGVDETVCPVSADLSRRVFQFPCHQELTTSELDWMIEEIRSAFLQMDGIE